MAVINLAGGTSGNTGVLASETLFYIASGKISLSSDAGVTKIPFDQGDKVTRSAGLTIHYFNDQAVSAELRTDPI